MVMGCGSSTVIPVRTTALQGDYRELWSRGHEPPQSSTLECSLETAASPPPSYSTPPPPYTAHARLGEVSIHRSPLQESDMISDDLLVDNPATIGWLEDTHTVQDNTGIHDDTSSYIEEQVAVSHDESCDQPAPLATSTPSSSPNRLHVTPNSNIFVKSLTQLPPAVKPVPLLRPIRAQHFSAPNLFATYPPPASSPTHEMDLPLNNTLPRVGRLPPLRRKPNLINNSPRYTRSLSDADGLFYDNRQTLSHSMSAGECEPISEVIHEPSSNDDY